MEYIDRTYSYNNYYSIWDLKCIEILLSAYKRVLKENELLRKDIKSWKKYCEEIEGEQTEMNNKYCELEFEVETLQKENEKYKEFFDLMLRLDSDYFMNCGDEETNKLVNDILKLESEGNKWNFIV